MENRERQVLVSRIIASTYIFEHSKELYILETRDIKLRFFMIRPLEKFLFQSFILRQRL